MSRCPICGMKECCGGELTEEIEALQEQLKEAREVIEFYDDLDRGKAGLRRNQAQLWLKKYGG